MAPPPPQSSSSTSNHGGETLDDRSHSSSHSSQSCWPPPRPDYPPPMYYPHQHAGDPSLYLQRQHFSISAYSIHHAPGPHYSAYHSHPIHPQYGYMHSNANAAPPSSSNDDYLSIGSGSQSLGQSFSFGDAMADFSAPELLNSNSMQHPERKATTQLGTFHDTEDGRKFVDEIFSDPQSPRLLLPQNEKQASSPIASPDHLNSVLSHESAEHPTVISTEGGEGQHHRQQPFGTLKFDDNSAQKFDENNPPSLQEHSSTSHDEEGDVGPINVPSTGSSEDETGSIVHSVADGQSYTSMHHHEQQQQQQYTATNDPHHHQQHNSDRRSMDFNTMGYPDQSYSDASLPYDMAHRQHYAADPRMMNAPQHHPPYQYPQSSSSSMQKRFSVMSPITMCFNRMLGAAEYIKTPGQPPQTDSKRCKRSSSELSLDGSVGHSYHDHDANPFDELAADPELERLVILQMAMQRQQHNNPYNSDRPIPPMIPREDNRVISEGFFWREYPACEQVLYNHMVRYYEISAIQRNYKVQQAFNNVLVEQVRKAAEDHGFEIDPNFDDKKLRDRIRCFYKTHLQNAKKRLATLQKHSESEENRSLVLVFIRCVRDPTLSLEESLEMATTCSSSKKRRLDKVEKLKMSVNKPREVDL